LNIVLLAVGLSALSSISVRAALVCDAASCTDTASFTGVVTDLQGQPLHVSKFDLPSNFVLQRVLVQLSGGMTTSGFVTNNSSTTADFLVQMFAAEYTGTAVGDIAVLPETQDVLDAWTSIHGPQFYESIAVGETV